MPKSTVELTVGAVLEARDLSVAEAAGRCGLSYSAMHALARGTALRVGLDTLAALCRGLEVGLDQVLVLRTPKLESED